MKYFCIKQGNQRVFSQVTNIYGIQCNMANRDKHCISKLHILPSQVRPQAWPWQQVYSTVQLKFEVKTKFPFISPTNSPDGNFCETVFPHYPPFSPIWGKLISSPENSVSPLGKHDFPIFPRISLDNSMIPQLPVQFSIQVHKCTLSLSIRPILCILHVSLKIRTPHYARQRI